MSLPNVVSRDEWVRSRKDLLTREKELTRLRDELNADRRRLPMVEVTEPYTLHGEDGAVGLLELFDGASQLIVHHFMFAPDWDEPCPTCADFADELSDGLQEHLAGRGTRLVLVSRAPLGRLLRHKRRRGWSVPWYSSHGSRFNHDFHVTLDSTVGPLEYNYRDVAEHEAAGSAHYVAGTQPLELHGHSCFLRAGYAVFHTYSTYARGIEGLAHSYSFLDLTALGRQEEWERPEGRVVEPRAAGSTFTA